MPPHAVAFAFAGICLASMLTAAPAIARVATAAQEAEEAALRAEEDAQEAADRAERAADYAGGAIDSSPTPKTKAHGQQRPIHDAWLTAKIQIALAGDERVTSRHVTVGTTRGIVSLRGRVETKGAKAAVEEIARNVEGITGVKNFLQVAPSQHGVTKEKDDTITTRITHSFKKDARLRNADIAVRTDAGIVTLTGKVNDLLMSARAAWTAWKVAGVRSVRNELSPH